MLHHEKTHTSGSGAAPAACEQHPSYALRSGRDQRRKIQRICMQCEASTASKDAVNRAGTFFRGSRSLIAYPKRKRPCFRSKI